MVNVCTRPQLEGYRTLPTSLTPMFIGSKKPSLPMKSFCAAGPLMSAIFAAPMLLEYRSTSFAVKMLFLA